MARALLYLCALVACFTHCEAHSPDLVSLLQVVKSLLDEMKKAKIAVDTSNMQFIDVDAPAEAAEEAAKFLQSILDIAENKKILEKNEELRKQIEEKKAEMAAQALARREEALKVYRNGAVGFASTGGTRTGHFIGKELLKKYDEESKKQKEQKQTEQSDKE